MRDSAFRSSTGLVTPARPSRRPCGRRVPLVLFLATCALSLYVLVRRRDGAALAEKSAADLEGADNKLLEVLIRTKDAIEVEAPLEDLASYADRAKVLLVRVPSSLGLGSVRRLTKGRTSCAPQELDDLGQSLNASFPHLNETTKGLYARSVHHHHQTLLQTLYPFVNKSPKIPRTVAGVSSARHPPRERETRAAEADGAEGSCCSCARGSRCREASSSRAATTSSSTPVRRPLRSSCLSRSRFAPSFPPRRAVHLIATLKHVHNTALPIHVVYAGADDLAPEKRAALRSIHPSVDTVDLLNFFDEDHVGIHGGGWAIKSFAILASPFREVIIADADAVFVQDPEILFDDPGYNATGTLFFRDREIFAGWGQVRPSPPFLASHRHARTRATLPPTRPALTCGTHAPRGAGPRVVPRRHEGARALPSAAALALVDRPGLARRDGERRRRV